MEEIRALGFYAVVDEGRETCFKIVKIGRIRDGFGDDVGGFREEAEALSDGGATFMHLVVKGDEDDKAVFELFRQEVGLFSVFFGGFKDARVEDFDGERTKTRTISIEFFDGFIVFKDGKEAVFPGRLDGETKNNFGDDSEGTFGAIENGEEVEDFPVLTGDVF